MSLLSKQHKNSGLKLRFIANLAVCLIGSYKLLCNSIQGSSQS